jgi:two-component system NtrC family response regulator/two-component system response regulator HydG
VRIIASTNRDPKKAIAEGKLRDDLFYRLAVVQIALPPLRERAGDIPSLVSHFVEKYGKAYGKEIRGLAPGTLNALLAHDWPGNIRELENVVERAVVLAKGPELTADDLPPSLRGPRPRERSPGALIPGATLYEIEREAILRTLEMVGGSTSRAAEILGISVRKIQYRLKEYAHGAGARTGDGDDLAEEPTGS